MATQEQIDAFITDMRTAVTEYGYLLSKKQRLGKSDIHCDRIKLILLSCYLDCLYDYFLQYPDDVDKEATNFFTIEEIRDVIQHVNNITGTFYMIEL
jgi:hypothetical protein